MEETMDECRDIRCTRTEPHEQHFFPEQREQCDDPFCHRMVPHAPH
jgi:hypothetical protein